jgi:hypothetical protein
MLDWDFGIIKLKIPALHRKNVPEIYLEWKNKVEWIFRCHNYLKPKNFKLVVIAFIDYTIIWLDRLVTNCRRNYERQVDTWEKMKSLIRRRFVPSHYYRELYQRLQSLSQVERVLMSISMRWNLLWFKLMLRRIRRLLWLDSWMTLIMI